MLISGAPAELSAGRIALVAYTRKCRMHTTHPLVPRAPLRHPVLIQQCHVLILTNCSSTQTSSSRSPFTCLASVSRSRRCILAPASPTTSHARSCNRRAEELLPATRRARPAGRGATSREQNRRPPCWIQHAGVLQPADQIAATTFCICWDR